MLEELLDLCEYLYNQCEYEKLISACDEVQKVKKDEPASLNYKAISLYYLGRYEESLELLDYSLTLHPTNHYTLNNKALVYIALKDYEKALECVEKGLESRNLDWLQINKIEALIHLGRIDEAYEYYQSVEIPYYTFEEALDNCGIANDSQKELHHMIDELLSENKYEEVIRLCDYADTSEKLLNYKIIALLYLKRFDEAIKCADGAIKSYPHNYNFHFLRARISQMTGDIDNAIESYENAFALSGLSNNRLEINDYNSCIEEKSKSLIDLKDYSGAVENLEKIITVKEGNFE